jgi:hypothetical protein
MRFFAIIAAAMVAGPVWAQDVTTPGHKVYPIFPFGFNCNEARDDVKECVAFEYDISWLRSYCLAISGEPSWTDPQGHHEPAELIRKDDDQRILFEIKIKNPRVSKGGVLEFDVAKIPDCHSDRS